MLAEVYGREAIADLISGQGSSVMNCVLMITKATDEIWILNFLVIAYVKQAATCESSSQQTEHCE
jgi:hypothetical protein